MSYVKSNLIQGETLIYETGIHWSALFWPFVLGILVIAGGVAFFFWQTFAGRIEMGTLLIAAAIVFLLYKIVQRGSTEIAVTNRRVIIKTGMAARRSLEIMLPKVECISVEESVWGRMLGYGTVMIHGTGGTPEPFQRIAHPNEFRQHVQTQIDQQPK